jgi:HEPN domain-containing protein
MGKYFMKEITKAWLLSAEGDLLLVNEIINHENLTHLSAFHSQQAIEKSFKAIIEEFDLGFFKTHSLEMLYNKVNEIIPSVINHDLLVLLDQLYIDSRYPGQFGLLPNGKPSISEAKEFFNLGKLFFDKAKLICKVEE